MNLRARHCEIFRVTNSEAHRGGRLILTLNPKPMRVMTFRDCKILLISYYNFSWRTVNYEQHYCVLLNGKSEQNSFKSVAICKPYGFWCYGIICSVMY